MMDKLPNILKEKIILDSIILNRNNYGWDKIHNYFKYFDLHLMKTHNVGWFDFDYTRIKRVSFLCFVNKPYTWLKKSSFYSNMYCYCKEEIRTINDLFSIDDEGIYFDDYDDYDDLYDDFHDD